MIKGFDAGKLNRLVAIQTKTTTYNSTGEPIDTWADESTVWAEIITTGGGEFYAAQKMYAQTTAVIRVRYTASITVLQRVRYGTRYFSILAVNDAGEAHRELQMVCKEVV